MDEHALKQSPRHLWREPQLLVLLLVVLGIYFPRLTALTIRGEESRRARVAVEILESGDWIVPTQQKQIYLSRPPLGSYPIAALGWLRGKVDLVAVRLPTVAAVLLTCVLIYAYARTFLSANGSLAAALAFATMGQVMEIGRLAETEATFTLLIASSLLLWHWGYSQKWPGWVFWSLGYAFGALAGLAKGPQGPVYFMAVACVYLLVRRDWKTIFGRSHAIGIAVFALVLGAWQVPYFLSTNLECSIGIWVNNAAQRFDENGNTGTLLTHVLVYPLEVLACMLPWSLLLLRYADRKLLAALGGARHQVGFLLTAILVTFPTVWFASTAKGRYYMPLYPCFAVLIGIVLDRCLTAEPLSHLRKVCRHYSMLLSSVLAFIAAAILIGSLAPVDKLQPVAQPVWFAVAYLAAAIAGGVIVWRSQRPIVGLTSCACLLGLTSTGVLLNAYIKASNDPRPAISEVKQLLPPGEQLASISRADHLFAYLYETPIEYHETPQHASDLNPRVRYFVIDGGPRPVAELPFAWEPVATVVLDRNRQEKPSRTVIVGRRLMQDVDNVARRNPKPQADTIPR